MTASPRSRAIARSCGYLALGIGAAIFLAWFASRWYGVAFSFNGKQAVAFNRGCINVEWARPGDADYAAMGFRRLERFSSITPGWRHDCLWVSAAQAGHTVLLFPLWWIGAPFVPVGAALVLWGRSIPRGHCARCWYNLSGLPPNAACPECGRHEPAPRVP
jgi:hypothetical protein